MQFRRPRGCNQVAAVCVLVLHTAEPVVRTITGMASRTPSRKSAAKAVWQRPAPRKAKHTHLTAKKKAKAKAQAKRAGRPYPNLVDNMRAARSKGR
jgi:hypothetical protein